MYIYNYICMADGYNVYNIYITCIDCTDGARSEKKLAPTGNA